jgi:DNA-binding CsgD family transcriptional regulator
MATTLDRSVLCPVLVGRAPYLDSLKHRLEQVGVGHGQIILITGEAGIGKSRLVAETKTLAAHHNFTTLQGNCFELDRSLPYAPLLDLLRGVIAAPTGRGAAPAGWGAVSALEPFAPQLSHLLPELPKLFPNLQPAPDLEPEQAKRRLFQTLTDFFVRALYTTPQHTTPLLLILEDLHWCDDTSLELLLHFAHRLANWPILLLLTCRTDEGRQQITLQNFLAELERIRLVVEFELKRLDSDQVAGMIRAIFAQTQPVQAPFTEAIHTLTDGNPFFVEETLKALVAAGDIYLTPTGWTRKPVSDLRIPRTVQAAVQRRTQLLSQPARQLLTLAAVAGRRFDFAVLQHITGHTETDLLKLIKELIAAQLVVEENADQFAFRHALTRQAILAELIIRERQPLHQQIVTALEILYANTLDNHLAELAIHTFEASLWAKALDYSRRAAERAQALYTPRAAVEHYTRAIDSAHHLAEPPPLGLIRERGQMHQTLGDFDAARTDFEFVIAAALQQTDQHAEWQALLDLGFLWAARDYIQTGRYFEQALELAQTLADSAALAHNLNRLGNWHLNQGQSPEAIRYHREALRIFESLSDQDGIAATHDLLGITYYASNDVHNGMAHYEQALQRFRAVNDRGSLASSLVIYASRGSEYIGNTAAPLRVPSAERLQTAQLALDLGRETDAPPAISMNTVWLGLNQAAAGNYGLALQNFQAGSAIAESIGHQHFLTVDHMLLGIFYLDILALPLALQNLERSLVLVKETRSFIWLGTVTAYLALTHLHLNDLAQAEATLATEWRPATPHNTVGQCHLWAARAELWLAQNQPGPALELLEQSLAAAANLTAENEHSIVRLSRLQGDCLIALRRYAAAEKTLLGALAWATLLELRPWQWRVWASLGKLYRAQGKLDQAQSAAARATGIVTELAATLNDSDLAIGFQNQAARQIAGPVAASPRESAKAQFGGLTARERDVARLIASGQSNQEIATTLTLSHRTVEAHIGNILSKLGFNSRSQIAVWAVEKGLPKT